MVISFFTVVPLATLVVVMVMVKATDPPSLTDAAERLNVYVGAGVGVTVGVGVGLAPAGVVEGVTVGVGVGVTHKGSTTSL